MSTARGRKNRDGAALHAIVPQPMSNAVGSALQYIERMSLEAAIQRFLDDGRTPAAVGPPVARIAAAVVSRGCAIRDGTMSVRSRRRDEA
jgi:hypothetical protein